MKYTSKWLQERLKHKESITSLNNAIITNNFDPYFSYRLRYISGLIGVFSLSTLLEFYFLFYFMGHSDAIHIILYRLMALASVSVWWGITEILRTRIRQLRLLKDFDAIKSEIRHWMTLTFLISAAFLLLCIYHILHLLSPTLTDADRLRDVYIAAVAFQISALILMSTLHSSLYALRRIVRPFISIPIGNIIGLLTLFVTYPFIQDYALAASYVIAALITVFLTTYYILRMNRVLLLLPQRWFSWKNFHGFLKDIPLKELCLAGLSAGLIAFQLVLVYFI